MEIETNQLMAKKGSTYKKKKRTAAAAVAVHILYAACGELISIWYFFDSRINQNKCAPLCELFRPLPVGRLILPNVSSLSLPVCVCVYAERMCCSVCILLFFSFFMCCLRFVLYVLLPVAPCSWRARVQSSTHGKAIPDYIYCCREKDGRNAISTSIGGGAHFHPCCAHKFCNDFVHFSLSLALFLFFSFAFSWLLLVDCSCWNAFIRSCHFSHAASLRAQQWNIHYIIHVRIWVWASALVRSPLMWKLLQFY